MSKSHGSPLRGLGAGPNPPSFQGRFGRMFPSLPHATFGSTPGENIANLTKLATAMTAGFDPPKDGKDDEESGIPSLYTYFGQFVDHDLTFDPASTLTKQDDPDALTDFRSPAFDLDNLYGRGPDDQPYLYDGSNAFQLGKLLSGGSPGARDLIRNTATPSRALIGDPRNDENSIVSQLQGLFHRFHNRIISEKFNQGKSFEDIQQQVRFHYQYVVLNDFLPRIVHSSVLSQLKTGGRYDQSKIKFFQFKKKTFMPIEFSVAAYRLGHSMVRPGYRLNDDILKPIFPIDPKVQPALTEGLTGFREMISDWGIDWGRFIDLDIRVYDGSPEDNFRRLQFAYRIDTSVVFPLGGLPPAVAQHPSSLPLRNLERGWRFGLPSGQSVATAMGLTPLADKDILIGKGVDKQSPPDKLVQITTLGKIFTQNCPLWAYVLAEAIQNKENVTIPVKPLKGKKVVITTPRLGPVGGRIVAEVFLGLHFADKHSLLNVDPTWQPKRNPKYALKDFVRYALGQ